ncbi:protocatechuate 3,4-dioxygenase [Nitrosococcus wardiae]|uniref:Intradiol ring-cleavage dioxygenases domain-containing protein n=1 Tax=Nitrosococcus wardiae TaxID=1814290 RepID=A0A4P7C195_9GAMM|nr:protocatechuate 3,4-dioxygenase [Nitrosococcus wardiae]QBQ55377.1 hypothetical protein E3U44_13295 [Nitrosococcus wardiae]
MSLPKKISRRNLLQAGLGAAASLIWGNLEARQTTHSPCKTPLQTEGPFYPQHDQADKDYDLTLIRGHREPAQGEVLHIRGQVLDEHCQPIPDVFVEIWQANTYGRYRHENDANPAPLDPHFQGWGKVKTDQQGNYHFKTIIPGPYPVNERWWRPPHIHFKVAKRGYHELTTQMYFAGHKFNEQDWILLKVPQEERAKVIVELEEKSQGDEPGAKQCRFNIALQRA